MQDFKLCVHVLGAETVTHAALSTDNQGDLGLPPPPPEKLLVRKLCHVNTMFAQSDAVATVYLITQFRAASIREWLLFESSVY